MKTEAYLKLFDARITGHITNPVTGRVIPRSDLVKIYRYLCGRSIKMGSGTLTFELLHICRKMLEIPKDVHAEILKEIGSSPEKGTMYDAKPYLLDELEAVREGRLKDGFKEVSEGAFEEYADSDILEIEKGSLIDQMETVKGVGALGDDMSFSGDFSLGELEPDLGKERISRRRDREVH